MKALLIVFITFNYSYFFSQSSVYSNKIDEEISSQFFIDTLYSQKLKENRRLTIYLPNGFNKDSNYPVIYATDGQLIKESYRKSLDSLIECKVIPRIVLVGVHSNEKFLPGNSIQYRNLEYISRDLGTDSLSRCFQNHYNFFTKEVMEYVENTYAVSSICSQRIFYGTSNGADFGIAMSMINPDLIQTYICCSIFSGTSEKFVWKKVNCPRFYIYYGNTEFDFVQNQAKTLSKYLKQKKVYFVCESYEGGHDQKMWESSFFKALSNIFKNR